MVNMYKLELTILQQEIIRYFIIKSGLKVNARKLAKELGVSPPAISKTIPLLQKNKILNVEKDKESGRFTISLNRDNPKIIQLKRVENLRMIYDSGLGEFLFNEFPNCAIILFGSFSRGEDIITESGNNSDIDLAIIGSKGKDLNLSEFEKALEREIRVNFFNKLNKIDSNLRNSILNGVVLEGYVDYDSAS